MHNQTLPSPPKIYSLFTGEKIQQPLAASVIWGRILLSVVSDPVPELQDLVCHLYL